MGTREGSAQLNDGKYDFVPVYEGEAVWAFKDEQAAMVEAVQVFFSQSKQYNLKDFEVLLGNDGPTAAFKSVGTFSTQNLKMMPDGWQTFTFPKTEAKYVKIKFINAHGGYIAAYELRVLGNLAKK